MLLCSTSHPGQEVGPMDPRTSITLATAGYGSLDLALLDHVAVWEACTVGDFHHSAQAVLTRHLDGGFGIERADNTATRLTWGDGLLAGALFVLLPGARLRLEPAFDAVGQRAIAWHFHRQIHPDDLIAASGVLADSRVGLVVLVVNRVSAQVREQLVHAREIYAIDLVWGELEEELRRDLVEFPRRVTGPDSRPLAAHRA